MNKFFVMLTVIAAAIWMMIVEAKADVYITISKSNQEMVVQTPEAVYVWDVSTGRKGFTTPSGQFKPYLLKTIHYSSKYNNAQMPHSIFFHGGYAIHATNEVKKLGRPASHGCIRLHPQNARWLYQAVNQYGKDNTYIEIIE
jgi:lipoprotein-anchoring transpeptidase ErfK/SrfK